MQQYTKPTWYQSGSHITAEAKIGNRDWLMVSLDLLSNILVIAEWVSYKTHVKTEIVTDFSVPKEEWENYSKWVELKEKERENLECENLH